MCSCEPYCRDSGVASTVILEVKVAVWGEDSLDLRGEIDEPASDSPRSDHGHGGDNHQHDGVPIPPSNGNGVAGVAGVTGDPGQPGHVGHVGHPGQAGCDGPNQREARPVATNTAILLTIELTVSIQVFSSSERRVRHYPHQLL